VATALFFVLGRAGGSDAAATDLPLDDAWIHLVYARALSGLEGFEYNPGMAEAGSSSPLWAVVLAPLFWIRLPWELSLVTFVKALGVIAAWAASVLGYRWLRVLGYGRAAAIAAGLAIAIDPWIGFAKVSGMEVPLAAALILAALLAIEARRDLTAGLALAAAVLTRPECALLVAGAGALLAWERRRNVAPTRHASKVLGPPVAAAIAWALHCLLTTGRPLPATFYAKHAAMPFATHFADAGELALFVATSGTIYAFVAGSVVMLRDAEPARRATRILAIALVPAWLLGVLWAHHFVERDAFYLVRYLLPIQPLVLVIGAAGVVELLRRVRELRSRVIVGALAAVAILVWLVPLPALADRYAWNCRNIREMNVAAALWLSERTVAGDWIASHDAGAVRFITDRPVVDLLGLNTHRTLDGGLPGVIAETRPRYWVVFPPARDHMTQSGRFRVAETFTPHRYTICSLCGQRSLVILEPW
jgi:hypothetical protein